MSEQQMQTEPGSQELERVAQAAHDALTDEMVARLASTAGGVMDVVDQLNRSGLARAIPTLAEMVANGDLERITQLARVLGSAQDALTDEMIGRCAETVGAGFSLLDRFNRGGADRLLGILERMEMSGSLERIASALPAIVDRLDTLTDILHCVESAAKESQQAPAAGGGIGGAWSLLTDAENQASLRFMLALGRQLRTTPRNR